MDFKRITLEDKDWISVYLQESGYRGCEFSFSTMMMWKDAYQTEVADYKGTLCYRCKTGKNHYVYAFPAGNGDKRAAIEALIDLAKQQGHKFIMRGFEKEWVSWLEQEFPDMFVCTTSQDEWDYVYSVEALSTLAGSKYHGKRNHIARFKDSSAWHYEPMGADNIAKCRDMSDIWYHMQLNIGNISVLKEKEGLHYMLEHMQELGLKGGVLYCADKVVAFTIGEPMSAEMFHVHIEKAYSDIQGAYPMINQQFVLHEMQGFTYVNREEDDGIEGLRKAKESYRPVEMIKKYTAVLKQVQK